MSPTRRLAALRAASAESCADDMSRTRERVRRESFYRLDQAACAISDTRSHVVAPKLGRASIRASHATRFLCGAPPRSPGYPFANTTTPFAGITIGADAINPCKPVPSATTPPPLPATCGLTQWS